MTRLFVAMEDRLLVVRRHQAAWESSSHLEETRPRCVAVDSEYPERLYCGTSDARLWRSTDAGSTWEQIGAGIQHDTVLAVATSPTERPAGYDTVYAGTEPGAVFRSDDGGDTWQQCHGLTDLPSASTWSFPPRPDTHHVRWIAPDPASSDRLYVAIEAGALVISPDGGKTWRDRVPGGPRDTHTLATHPDAQGRLYAAAGDGYFESHDGGETWEQPQDGLQHRYCWGVVVDPADPETVIVSAASGAYSAHNARRAESFLYRKTAGESWQQVRAGLPAPRGTSRSVLAAHPDEVGTFYAANNHGIFRSTDAGQTWTPLDVDWPETRDRNAEGMAVVPE